MNEEFKFKIHDNAGLRNYRCLRFPFNSMDKYSELIRKLNYSYCFVSETYRNEQTVLRKVDSSNSKEIIGIEFEYKLK